MKITPEHYAFMRDKIKALNVVIPSLRERLKAEPRVKDLEKRLRWDLSYAAGLSGWICDNVYTYADDTHVDTALRAIVAELEG